MRLLVFFGFIWAFVELIAGHPFDALVTGLLAWALHEEDYK